MTRILQRPEWLPDGYDAAARGVDHWAVSAPDETDQVVTTDRARHDYAAGAVAFFGPGNPTFPPAADADEVSMGQPPSRSIQDILNTPVQ